MKNKFVSVIIPSAGSGRRMFLEEKKQFIKLAGIEMIVRTLDKFNRHEAVDEIIVVTAKEDIDRVKNLVVEHNLKKVSAIVKGGKERQDSIQCGLNCMSDQSQFVMVHDGARPFVDADQITASIQMVSETQSVILAVPVKDTIKVCKDDVVEKTLDRKSLWQVQTPQTFEVSLLKRAYAYAKAHDYKGTDDASLLEFMGEEVITIHGDYENIKITTKEDLDVASKILGKSDIQEKKRMRVGMGYDVHKLVEGRDLILGGVKIEHHLGLLGHSDADVLIHAVMDAILGALGLGDIGKHFPDTDSAFEGISSMKLLSKVMEAVKEEGYVINNLDCTVIAQKPKLLNYIPTMQANIAQGLMVSSSEINVKATTTEKLGFAGREEGIAAEAIVSLIKA